MERWLEPMVKKWVTEIETLVRIAVRFPQTAYAGLVSSLQAEWQYICRILPGAGQYLEPVESALWEKFIPALLQVSEPVDDVFFQLLSHGVKMGRIAIKNPVTSALGDDGRDCHQEPCHFRATASSMLDGCKQHSCEDPPQWRRAECRDPQGCGQGGWERCLQGKA